MFGLTQDQLDYITQVVVSPLRGLGNEVYCFGSRARLDHQPFSDLDLMVEGPSDCSREISRIQEILSTGNFPFKVDLVSFPDLASTYVSGYQKDKVVWPK